MINPAQYQQVLQKMPDQALMQLLKRPDKIPSQFVVQEINRRKQMRQAGQAQKQQVANAVAMQQQQPVQTPEGQPAMGMSHGGPPPHPEDRSFLNKLFNTPYRGKDMGLSSLIPKRNPNRGPSYNPFTGFVRGVGDQALNTARAGLNVIDYGIDTVKSPFQIAYQATQPGEAYLKSKQYEGDEDDYESGKGMAGTKPALVNQYDEDDYESGIKSIESGKTKSENENLVESAKENINKIPESNINNQFSTMLNALDTKLQKTKEPFNRDMLINGFKNSELFDTTAASFTELNDKSKARVEAFNTRSDELRQAREKMIGDLEKEGRTKENIVFESLITTGLNLMSSPNANFTQALGEAGKAGLATFQSLRKEEKDRVRQKHLMAYQLAEQEFAHKNQADQLESSLDLQKVNFNKTLQEMSRTEKKDFIEESKLAKELDQKDEQLGIMADKNALEITKTKINSLIAMDKLAVEKAGMNSLIQHRQNSTDLENKKLDSNVTVLSYMIQNKTDKETPDDIINKYIASQSNSTELGKAQQDLIRDIGKELAKKVDLERAVADKEYAASILVTLQDTLETFRDFSFGSGTTSDAAADADAMAN